MSSFYVNHSDMTQDEIAEGDRVRPLLLALGKALMLDAGIDDARKALESGGVTLSAELQNQNAVILRACFGRFSHLVGVPTEKAAQVAALFPVWASTCQGMSGVETATTTDNPKGVEQ